MSLKFLHSCPTGKSSGDGDLKIDKKMQHEK